MTLAKYVKTESTKMWVLYEIVPALEPMFWHQVVQGWTESEVGRLPRMAPMVLHLGSDCNRFEALNAFEDIIFTPAQMLMLQTCSSSLFCLQFCIWSFFTARECPHGSTLCSMQCILWGSNCCFCCVYFLPARDSVHVLSFSRLELERPIPCKEKHKVHCPSCQKFAAQRNAWDVTLMRQFRQCSDECPRTL